MMEYVYTCDCCGKRVPEGKLTECFKGIETFKGKYDDFSGMPLKPEHWDLCDDCKQQLEAAMLAAIGRIQNS